MSDDQILSQEEVNSLLSAVDEGDVDTGSDQSEEEQEDLIHYDLTSNEKIVRGRMPALEIINDRFARNFRVSLSNNLRKIIDIDVESTSITKFSEFLNSLPIPSCLNIMSFAPLRGQGLIVVEARLLYALATLFFGGKEGARYKVEGREFSPVELTLVERLVKDMAGILESAWEMIHEVSVEFIRTEVNPQFVGVVPPGDVVVSTTFEVEMEQSRGKMFLMMPYSTIEPIREKLSSSIYADRPEPNKAWRKRIMQNIMKTDISSKVVIGSTTLNIRDLYNLKKGDIIELDNSYKSEIPMYVQNVPKMSGYPVVSNNKYAFKIKRFLAGNSVIPGND
ncbi:MAG: flagellar motor switch protein FliM [bacterium]